MQNQKEVTTLLSTIKKAISNSVPLKSITDNIRKTFSSEKEDVKLINLIITSCCKEYDITKHQLLYDKRGVIHVRYLCVLLMMNELDMSFRKSSSHLIRSHRLSAKAKEYYENLNPQKFEEDKIFLEKYAKIKNIIKERK